MYKIIVEHNFFLPFQLEYIGGLTPYTQEFVTGWQQLLPKQAI